MPGSCLHCRRLLPPESRHDRTPASFCRLRCLVIWLQLQPPEGWIMHRPRLRLYDIRRGERGSLPTAGPLGHDFPGERGGRTATALPIRLPRRLAWFLLLVILVALVLMVCWAAGCSAPPPRPK